MNKAFRELSVETVRILCTISSTNTFQFTSWPNWFFAHFVFISTRQTSARLDGQKTMFSNTNDDLNCQNIDLKVWQFFSEQKHRNTKYIVYNTKIRMYAEHELWCDIFCHNLLSVFLSVRWRCNGYWLHVISFTICAGTMPPKPHAIYFNFIWRCIFVCLPSAKCTRLCIA